MTGEISKRKPASAIARRYPFREPPLHLLIIYTRVPSRGRLGSDSMLRSYDYRQMKVLAVSRVLTDLNPQNKLCLTSEAMSTSIERRCFTRACNTHGFLKLAMPSDRVHSLNFQEGRR